MARDASRLKHDEQYKKILELGMRDPVGLRKRVLARRCELPGGLLHFVRLTWHCVEPEREFAENWHINAICEHLEAVTFGKITRLLINVPPGFMKPASINSLVLTLRGRIRLGEVVVGDEILTHKGRFRRVEEVHEQGTLPSLTVLTEMGRRVQTEPSHPYLTPRGWIAAQDLRVGDTLAAVIPREPPVADLVSLEEARLLGYLVGDGSVTHSPSFTNGEEDALCDFERCAKSLGFGTTRAALTPSEILANFQATKIGLRGSLRWLEQHGLRGCNSYTKRIPQKVLRSGPEVIANFLGAYWTCDGTFNVRHTGKRGSIYVASCTTVGFDLAEDIQHALLRLGISSRIRECKANIVTKKQPGGVYLSYSVMSCNHQEVAKFSKLSGLCERKRKNIEGLLLQQFDQGPLVEDRIVEISDGGMVECRCLTVADDHSFTANDIALKNSLLLNVFWPAWEWGPMRKSSFRYVAASYSQDLTIRDNVRFRQIIMSDIYREHWGHFGPGLQFNLEKVGNDKSGWKLATSTGGVGTGERGDRILVDDPNNVKDTESDTIRDSTNRWFTEIIPTRYNDPAKSAIIVIQQRTHEEDVSGVIISRDLGYDHLMIPMRYDSTRRYTTSIGWTDPRGLDANGEETDANEGALAWADRYTEDVVDREERIMGPYASAGQFMQSPSPRGGAIFERDWWQPWPINENNKIIFPQFEYVIASVDTAFTEKQENDYSAMTVWGIYRDTGDRVVMPRHVDDPTDVMRIAQEERPKVMLMWGWQKRLALHGPPEERPYDVSVEAWNAPYWIAERQKKWGLVEWVVHTARRWHIDHLLIETQAAGHSLDQELRRLHSGDDWGVQLIHAKGDKKARAIAVQHLFSNGLVHAPCYPDGQYPTWCGMIVDQFCSFPKTRHKDLVDSGTHALQHLRDAGVLVRKEEHDQSYEDMMRPPGKKKALYDV